jgi:Skp family chaperone for outer membrane proteins
MMRIFTFSFLAACAAMLCSCGRPAATGTTAVVVDLDAVARAVGWDLLIDKRVEQATQALNAKLIGAAESMEKELKKQQAEFGASATDEQRAKLKQTAQKIQENIQSNKEIAGQARQRVRLEQIQLFRNEVKTIAARLAAKQQASLVIVAGQEVLWFTPSADITAAVIAEMRNAAALPPAAEAGKPPTASQTNKAAAVPRQSQPVEEAPANTNR